MRAQTMKTDTLRDGGAAEAEAEADADGRR